MTRRAPLDMARGALSNSRRALVVPAILAAAVLAFLLERWIVTDREAVERLLEDTSAQAERGEWEAVRRALDDGLEGIDPDAFVAWARRTATTYGMRGWRAVVDDVTVEGDRAAARVVVQLSSFAGGDAWSRTGRVGLVRTPDGWRIRSVSSDDPRWLR